MPLFSKFELTETSKRRVFFSTAVAAWIAIVGVVVLTAAFALQRPQRPIDVIAEVNDYVDASFWARDYLLLWLGGGAAEAEKLASMTAGAARVELNSDPVTVFDIRSAPGVLRTVTAGEEIEWAMTLSAVIVPPGGGGASIRTYYRVTFLQAGSTYKALMYPRPVNATTQPVQIQSHYTTGVDLTGPLADTVGNFMTGFYAAGNDGALGRFVAPEFTDDPIAGSPYTTVAVTGITTGSTDPDPATAKPGDTMHILVTAKASASTDTFNLISAPLRVTLSPNQQWLVAGFDEPVRFGEVSYQ